MLNIYKLLKIATCFQNSHIRLLGLWVMYVSGKRTLNINLDPVLGCNLRCQMCYFSDPKTASEKHGRMTMDFFRKVASAFFGRAIRLQLGCGAEPTLHNQLPEMVKIAKDAGVMHVSLVTNGNLLTYDTLRCCLDNGLNELIVSCHGFTSEIYETLMERADFSKFLNVLGYVREVKQAYPQFRFRLNYTINNYNCRDLSHMWDVVGNDILDVIQIRPVQDLGVSKYRDFNLASIHDNYDSIIQPIVDECRQNNIVCLAPSKENLQTLMDWENLYEDYNPFMEFSNCYISSNSCWRDDFNIENDTYNTYTSRNHYGWKMLRKVFVPHTISKKKGPTVAMNYHVK